MLKKTLNYLIFSILSSVIGFLTIAYMARTISQESMGVVGLFMAMLFIAPQFVSFASTGLISINKVKYSREDFSDFSKSYLSFGFVNFIFIFIMSCFGGVIFKGYWQIFVLLPVIAFLMFIVSFHQTELVQDGLSKIYGIYNLLLSAFTAILTVLFLSVFSLDWEGRLWAILFGQMIIVFTMYKLTFDTLREFKAVIDKILFKEFFYFGAPLFIGLGAGWVLNQADNYIVLYFFTLEDVGLYAVAYSIGAIVNTINKAATNAIVPRLYKSLEKKEGHKIVRKLNIYFSVSIVVISLIIGLSSYWYMPLIFGDKYANTGDIVLFISLAFGFNGIYRTSGGVISFYKRNTLQMNLIYLSAVVNIVISIILIPHLGMLSPAIGTFVAYIVLAYLSYVYGWKILKEEEFVH